LVTESTLSYAEAKSVIDAISAELTKQRKAAVIVVADTHGELIALARMDGAPLSSLAIAANKAWTAARERKPSKDIGNAARDPQNAFDIGYFGDPKFTGWGGGVPVSKDGKLVGAIAVSGLPEAEDIALAEYGAATLS